MRLINAGFSRIRGLSARGLSGFFVRYGVILLVLASFSGTAVLAQDGAQQRRDWQENKFSMFIHFGLYSELGGVWEGKRITRGYSEQIQSHAGIYSDRYAAVADRFNPTGWNADSIVSLARQAGMRSIVLTAKHHDGFCMFRTGTTDFNIADATPFGRDVVGELARACKQQGLDFGLYFSLIDWHYPQAYPISSHNADFITPQHHAYNKKQLTELLSNYGPISELWFDMGSLTLRQSRELRELVKSLQPGCMISGRLGNDQGDFSVMGDNQYPDYAIVTPWQVPASLYDETWGYRSWQLQDPVNEKSAEKLRGLIRTVAHGGNYLLNIGPTGEGTVTDHEQEVLLQMGRWLGINGEAIYATQPVSGLPWPEGTALTQKGNHLYLHLLDFLPEPQIQLRGLQTGLFAVYPMEDPSVSVPFHAEGGSLRLELTPEMQHTGMPRVLVLELESEWTGESGQAARYTPGMELNRENATPYYSFSGVDYYSSYRSTVAYGWAIRPEQATTVRPVLYYSQQEEGLHRVFSAGKDQYTISFSGGTPQPLESAGLRWGPAYRCGPFPGFMDALEGEPEKAGPANPWGGKAWEPIGQGNEHSGDTMPAGMFRSWYSLKEVSAAAPSQVAMGFPLNDGLAVYLDGKEQLIINNPRKEPGARAIVLLDLSPGTHTLLVRYFNRFGKSVVLGADPGAAQVVYRMELPPIRLAGGQQTYLKLGLPEEIPVHRHIGTPNVRIVLEPMD